ncbi:hypothetical protein PFISCL1PPCAC_8078, partial [Pristionchus fissidentatus]
SPISRCFFSFFVAFNFQTCSSCAPLPFLGAMANDTLADGEITVSEGNTSSGSPPEPSKPLCVSCGPSTALEEEAMLALKEAAPSVTSISISEMLPRTSDLLFMNLTTLEGQTYCIELCQKGYRIASARQDCMNGDFRQLDLHIRYFESIYQLLDTLSPSHRDKFASSLAEKLSNLPKDNE